MDWHTLFIILHATAAAICLIVGLAAVWPPRARAYPWLFAAFFVSLISMVVFVIAAVISHWLTIDSTARLVFSGLILLGLYMIYRAIGARGKRRNVKLSDGYIDDVGFVLISLVVGLLIVPLIRLEVPVWFSAPILLLVVLAGTRLLKLVKARTRRDPA